MNINQNSYPQQYQTQFDYRDNFESEEEVFQSLFERFFFPGNIRTSKPRNRGSFPFPNNEQFGNRATANRKTLTQIIKCTLQDLYNGCEKLITLQEKIYDKNTNRLVTVKRQFPIQIKRAWKYGTKIKFPPSPSFPISAEFILQPEDDARNNNFSYFERNGNDLIWKCVISSKNAENGIIIKLPLLDGSTLVHNTTGEVIKNGMVKVFPQKGMPIPRSVDLNSGNVEYGNLIVKFIVNK